MRPHADLVLRLQESDITAQAKHELIWCLYGERTSGQRPTARQIQDQIEWYISHYEHRSADSISKIQSVQAIHILQWVLQGSPGRMTKWHLDKERGPRIIKFNGLDFAGQIVSSLTPEWLDLRCRPLKNMPRNL